MADRSSPPKSLAITKLFQDYQIPFREYGEHHHVTKGWVNVCCPFCEDHNFRMGYNLDKGYFHCWHCGGHNLEYTLSRLTGLSTGEVKELLRSYRIHKHLSNNQEGINQKVRIKKFKLPSHTGPLLPAHRRYLRKRGLDPDEIEASWLVKGTGPVGMLDKVDLSWRLVIPIYWQGRMVSFQTRAISDKGKLRYISCPKDRQVVEMKQIVYTHPFKKDYQSLCIVVEGVFDVWKIGPHAVATFGISYKQEQVESIVSIATQRRVAVLFDPFPREAVKQAHNLTAQLLARGLTAGCFQLVGAKDPGELAKEQTQAVLSQIRETLYNKDKYEKQRSKRWKLRI